MCYGIWLLYCDVGCMWMWVAAGRPCGMDEAACWEVAWEGLLEVIWDGGVAGRDETWEGVEM